MKVIAVILSEENDELLQRLAEASLRLSPQIATGDRCLFIEIGKIRKIYTEKTLLLRLQSFLKRFEIKNFKVGVGDDIPTARARAFFQSTRLPIEALQIYATPFRTSSSLEKPILNLKRLGIDWLDEFAKIPATALASRFGKEGIYARHYLDQVRDIAWPFFQAKERISESDTLSEGAIIRDFEPLLFLLKKIVDRALARLFSQGKQAMQVRVRIHLDKYSTVQKPTREWIFEFAFAQGSVFGVLPILRERIERDLQKEPLESPVESLEFEILDGILSRGRQKDFFNKKEEETEGFNAVVSRLTEKLGFAHVFLAQPQESYWPDGSWRKTLDSASFYSTSSKENEKPPLPQRPLRMLRKPQKIVRIEASGSGGGSSGGSGAKSGGASGGGYFVLRDRKWRVTELKDFERLSGAWWTEQNEREYFRVEVATGEELWIFLDTVTKDYYLHGIFD